MRVGTVAELWRYPVKSMAGEQLAETRLGSLGIPGDRGWALRDETAQEIRGAKKIAGLLHCSARYCEEPDDVSIPPVVIGLPDGRAVGSDDPRVAEQLSEVLGRPVTLWPRRPADELDHYRRGIPDHDDLEVELRDLFGLLPEEPFGDLTTLPPEILEFTSPLGTYFDCWPLHLLTTASMQALARRLPDAVIEVRRFRPNVLVETVPGLEGFVDAEWSGRNLRVGDAVVHLQAPAIRCVMTTRSQPGIPEDRRIMRTLVSECAQNLGLYATVVAAGRVAPGDPVELV